MDSKLKDIVKNPEAKAVLQKYFPVDLDSPTIKIAYGMTLRKCCSFPQVDISDEKLAELEAELEAVAG
jgi:hypothetical protein